jgi:hypothetical protein
MQRHYFQIRLYSEVPCRHGFSRDIVYPLHAPSFESLQFSLSLQPQGQPRSIGHTTFTALASFTPSLFFFSHARFCGLSLQWLPEGPSPFPLSITVVHTFLQLSTYSTSTPRQLNLVKNDTRLPDRSHFNFKTFSGLVGLPGNPTLFPRHLFQSFPGS